MSTISSIAPTAASANSYLQNLATTLKGDVTQTFKDIQTIGTALRSNNLASAKSALTNFVTDLPANLQTSASQIFGNNTPASADFQKLTSALQTGNLAGAQTAFSALTADLQSDFSGAAGGGASFNTMLNNLLGQASSAH